MVFLGVIDKSGLSGNTFLNVGPTAGGEIPGASIERLKDMAAWMGKHGEAIHGTTANPLPATPWGRCTAKTMADGTTRLYLHIFDWPKNGKLSVKGIPGSITAAGCLTDPSIKPVWASDKAGSHELTLSPQAPDKIASVITLDVGTKK